MDESLAVIEERSAYCLTRLYDLVEQIKSIDEIDKHPEFCIYVTGSYARLEAASNSDLDLFFVHSRNKPVSNISKILIDAGLINIQKNMDLPAFSGDGKFLQIHTLEDITDNLGSSKDDYENHFTARMLLLTESKPVYNEEYYKKVLKEIVEAYFRDFHGHETNFQPIFLTNDLIRFWKTLCLNYEHSRNREEDPELEEGNTKKLKAHRKNLKLRFSRKMTCFSFLIMVISKYKTISVIDILEIVNQTPIERLNKLCESNIALKPNVDAVLTLYGGFLSLASENDNWLENKDKRDEEFKKGREFGDRMFDLLVKVAGENNSEVLKYLIS